MVRFRYLALIFLFLSPAAAARGSPVGGHALLGVFVGDPDCADGVKSGKCILSFQLRAPAKLLFDGLRDEAQRGMHRAALEKSAAMVFLPRL